MDKSLHSRKPLRVYLCLSSTVNDAIWIRALVINYIRPNKYVSARIYALILVIISLKKMGLVRHDR